MEKIIMYVAFDGTKFDDEDECLDYEFEKRAENYINYFTLYNHNRKPLKFSADKYLIDSTCYIVIKDEKAVSFLDDWMIECGCYTTIGKAADIANLENRVGLWMWDDPEENWKHWETEIAKMREFGEYFQRFEE